MKYLFCVLLFSISASAQTIRWAGPAGSGSTCSFASPCSLKDLLNGTIVVAPGDSIYLRADQGEYRGIYTSVLTGTAGARIKVRTDPDSPTLAKINGYVTTTLANSIDSSTITVVLTDGTNFPENTTLQVGNECILLRGKSGTTPATYNNCIRDRGCSDPDPTVSPSAHSAGLVVWPNATTLTISGTYTDYTFMEFTREGVRRIVNYTINVSSGVVGDLVLVAGTNNKIAMNVFHDGAGAMLAFESAGVLDTEGNISTNIGWIGTNATDRPPCHEHGTGFYMQSDGQPRTMTNDIIGHTFSTNKAYGIAGSVKNFTVDGLVAFQSGNPPCVYHGFPNNAKYNFELKTESIPMELLTVRNSHFWHNSNIDDTPIYFGNSTGHANKDITVENNVISGGENWLPQWYTINFTGNRVIANHIGARFLNVKSNPAGFTLDGITYGLPDPTTWTWRDNEYYLDQPTNFPFSINTVIKNYSQWQSQYGWDTATGELATTYTGTLPTGQWKYVRPITNYPGYANLIAYNWNLSTTVTFDLTTSGLTNNQAYVVRDAEAPLGILHSGTYTTASPNVTLDVSDVTRIAQPVPGPGETLGNISVSAKPLFAAFRVEPVGAVAGPPAPSNFNVDWAFSSHGQPGNANLTWTDIVGETGYIIDKSDNGTTWVNVTTTAANATSYTVTGLANSGLWYYRIRSVSGGGESTNIGPVTLTATALSCYGITCGL